MGARKFNRNEIKTLKSHLKGHYTDKEIKAVLKLPYL